VVPVVLPGAIEEMVFVKKALITGITGQDGSYLTELLIEKEYKVHGIVRRSAIEDPDHRMSRLTHLLNRIVIHPGSIESYPSVFNVVKAVQPDECYHLAAQSFVDYSFSDSDEFSTLLTNINGTHHILSAIKEIVPACRLYFAGSSEMFGNAEESPQNEKTRFMPRSSYGISKLTGYHLVRNYREGYALFAVNGILFNHESPRRGFEFVTRKISSHVAKIKVGLATELRLGNLDARRDWGHAKDYVKAMWMMLQTPSPQDYVVGTGENHSVREFAETAFDYVGLDYRKFVIADEKHYRPAESHELIADASKAKTGLGWTSHYRFIDLVQEMVENDLEALDGNRKGARLRRRCYAQGHRNLPETGRLRSGTSR